MNRVSEIKPAGQWNDAGVVDRIILDAGDRPRRRIVLKGESGKEFLLDLAKPASLRDGDGLVLDDGSIVRVCGRSEDLMEIGASSPREFVRLAWHLGNRHTDVQIVGGRIRIRRDHVLEDMLRGLGAMVRPLEAAFDPEAGAHGQDHAHSHANHHHDHGHGHHGHGHER